MGGRGGAFTKQNAKKTGMRGVDVTINGNTTRYYFKNVNGINYYQRWLPGIPEPVPRNMSFQTFKKTVEANGAVTKNVSHAEMEKEKENYVKYRAEMDSFLNRNDAKNKEMSRGSRSDRITNRANARNRRK